MRTTLALDDELLKEAQHLTGTTEKTAVVRQAWVTGELGLGSLSRRAEVLGLLTAFHRPWLPQTSRR